MAVNYDPQRLDSVLAKAVGALSAARAPGGAWTGELSGSALATATAVGALALVRREGVGDSVVLDGQVSRGLAWLASHANGDGGWGDTTRSLSNLSTTVLAWSAFGLAGADSRFPAAVAGAERWIKQNAGRLEPHILVPAIVARYGRDRTFSVPILMTAVLGGRLGPPATAWRRVPALPFELAALPRGWFPALRLPVVSYALPALIAIGQARHCHAPSANPLARLARVLAGRGTRRVLEAIQPANGGFLEATPLTSFVALALAASGQAGHPVTLRAVDFLVHSVREEGCWPIDTNLATWLTTLSVNALGAGVPGGLLPEDCAALRWWLLRQQHRRVHDYTGAAPGGWAWTDQPGGVPDADDTAGALLALRQLGAVSPEVLAAAQAGLQWLLGLQNRDGGMPTFCRGWGALPFDRSGADLTAHALRAWLAWLDALPPGWQERIQVGIGAGVRFLIRAQRADGAWAPLWFGNQFAPGELNLTHGTSRVLLALPELVARSYMEAVEPLNNGAQWLARAQNRDGGWGGAPGVASSVEETALAVEALAELMTHPQPLLPDIHDQVRSACAWGADWLVRQVENGQWCQPNPIGFYFARLWYFEKLYPLIFTASALRKVRRLAR